jgi:dynein light chain roadblock-type
MMKGLEDEEGPETSLRKLTQTFGVQGYVVLNKSGIPVKFHGMESAEAVHYAGLLSELVRHAREFLDRKLFRSDDSTELENLRLRTRKHEIIIAPEEHYTLVVIQNPNYTEPIAATKAAVLPTVTETQPEQ